MHREYHAHPDLVVEQNNEVYFGFGSDAVMPLHKMTETPGNQLSSGNIRPSVWWAVAPTESNKNTEYLLELAQEPAPGQS